MAATVDDAFDDQLCSFIIDVFCRRVAAAPPSSGVSHTLPVPQDIECLASDGMLLASCCLAGQIRVWDAQTGDCLTVIPNNG